MRWWRANRRTGAALAVFAMLFQFVLAFGHVHELGSRSASPHSATASLAGDAADPRGQRWPASIPDDDCPICVVIHMAANGVLPEAPLVLVPDDFTRPHHQAAVHFDVVARRYAFFQTRAPPRA